MQRAESQQLERNENKPMSYFNIIGNTRIKDERVINYPYYLIMKNERRKIMSKVIKGKKYMLVDVIVIGDLIYDIYEDEQGNRIKLYSDYVR